MRKKYIAGNWKMFGTVSECTALARSVVEGVKQGSHRYLVAPPFTALSAVAEVLKGTNVLLGAQNMSNLESGARTGDISVLMLKDLGVETVIIGHSERRQFFAETDELINEKIHLALKHGLEVIFCNGETLTEREAGKVEEVVFRQTEVALKGISAEQLKKITIAYEPVWAIGTGKTATPEDANAVHKAIRGLIAKLYDQNTAENVIIQYGGSVKPDNAQQLMNMPDIDGALVGGASLKAETFLPIALVKEEGK